MESAYHALKTEDDSRLEQARVNIFVKFKAFKNNLEKDLARSWNRPTLRGNHSHRKLDERISELSRLVGIAEIEIDTARLKLHIKDSKNLTRVESNTRQAKSTLDGIKRFTERTEERNGFKDRESMWANFRRWLSRHKSDDNHFDSIEIQAGTCGWLRDRSEFQAWQRPVEPGPFKSRILWINGTTGTGKTSLAAYSIRWLRDQCHNWPLAYFFCQGNSEAKRESFSILSSLSWQILANQDDLLRAAFENFEKVVTRDDHATLGQLRDLLDFLLDVGSPCRVILDGLDELEEPVQREIFKALQGLSQKCLILILSRDQGTIRDELMTISAELIDLRISATDTEEDVQLYISKRLDLLQLDPQYAHGIKTQLISKSQGMFQYASVMLLHLSNFDADEMMNALDQMPTDLQGLYEVIFSRMYDPNIVHSHGKDLVERAIIWILWAGRDLTLKELLVGLSVFKSGHNKDDVTHRMKNFQSHLRKAAGSILVFGDEEETITLSHNSVREYLLEPTCPFAIYHDQSRAHSEIAQACFAYISSDHLHLVEVNDDEDWSLGQLHWHSQTHIFLEYAAVFWWWHTIYHSPSNPETLEKAMHDFMSSERLLVRWLQMFYYFHQQERSATKFMAAQIGLKSSHALVDERFLDQAWVHHLGPVSGARMTRWEAFVCGGTPQCYLPISIAAHFDYVEFLSDSLSQNPNLLEAVNDYGETPLYEAARAHALNAIDFLISAGASVNCPLNVYGDSPLTISLQPALPYNCTTSAFGPNHATLRLLEAGANPFVVFGDKRTIWHFLAEQGNSSWESLRPIAEQLVKMGCTPLMFKKSYWQAATPLHLAASWGLTDFLRFLLEVSNRSEPVMNVSILEQIDNFGFSAIHYACDASPNTRETLDLFLKHGGSAQVQSGQLAWTPLHYAVLKKNIEAIRVLCSNRFSRAKPNQEDANGHTPLHLAILKDSPSLVQILLDCGEDPLYQGYIDLSPLRFAQQHWRYKAAAAICTQLARIATVPDASNIESSIAPLRLPHKVMPSEFRSATQAATLEALPTARPFRVDGRANNLTPLVVSAPLIGRSTGGLVKSITFTTLSQDRSKVTPHGSQASHLVKHHQAPTGYRLRIMTESHSIPSVIIYRNCVGGSEPTRRCITWSIDEDTEEEEGGPMNDLKNRMLESLKPGDVLGLVPFVDRNRPRVELMTWEASIEVVTFL